MDKELQILIGRLQDYSKGCEDKCLDFQALKFEAKESEMRLYTDFRSYYFKSDPKNPRHPKVIHAAKQFCKMIGTPYNFFIKNPEYMRNQIVGCWLPTVSSEKAAILGKLRKTPESENYVIRALLPVEYTNISNTEIMALVGEAIGDDFKVDFVIGDERDDLVLHARFISNATFDACKEVCSTGFSIIISELGAMPISVDTFLFRNSSKASMMASYGGQSFFESAYEGVQPATLKELFPRLICQLKGQLTELKSKIYSAKDKIQEKEDSTDLLKNLRFRKGLSEKFHILMMQEIEANPVENRWEFVNRMSILAKDFELTTRVKIERAAGELIGLCFEKA